MDKHLIIIDLDGTLMLNFGEYEQCAVEYLKKLNELGHIILIATGRPFRSSFFVHQAIGLNTPIINYNGALVSNPFDDCFPKTDLRVKKEYIIDIINFIGDNLVYRYLRIAQNGRRATHPPLQKRDLAKGTCDSL